MILAIGGCKNSHQAAEKSHLQRLGIKKVDVM